MLLVFVSTFFFVGGVTFGYFELLTGLLVLSLVFGDIVLVFLLALAVALLFGHVVVDVVALLLGHFLALLLRHLVALGDGVVGAVLLRHLVTFGDVDVVTRLLRDFLAFLLVVVRRLALFDVSGLTLLFLFVSTFFFV